jgi:hypothetical protein
MIVQSTHFLQEHECLFLVLIESMLLEMREPANIILAKEMMNASGLFDMCGGFPITLKKQERLLSGARRAVDSERVLCGSLVFLFQG